MAAIRYGYPAMTDDIDIVASRDALDELLSNAPMFGFRVQWRSKSGWHTISFEDVEITKAGATHQPPSDFGWRIAHGSICVQLSRQLKLLLYVRVVAILESEFQKSGVDT
ncbi:MAG: hypothetical protein NT069_27035 [Planctomycetota bacterium]|nr:hypothetical protein [Planctomycetota bacterium]